MSLGEALLDVLCPARCAVCGVPTAGGRAFCDRCSADLPWWRRVDGCPLCGTPRAADAQERAPVAACPECLARGSALHLCLALTRYEEPMSRLLPAFKRAARPFGPPIDVTRAIEQLACELGDRAASRLPDRPDAVVSIPLHPLRRLRRGFNPVDPVAARVSARLGVPWMPGWLRRTRATPPQAARDAESRARNVAGAFRAAPGLPGDARVWLVDDVLTTGSTLESAAGALLEAGALEVRALTLSATLPPARRRQAPAERLPVRRTRPLHDAESLSTAWPARTASAAG